MRAFAYSTCIEAAVRGEVQRGMVHSAFTVAANVAFSDGFVLSLNAITSPRMPNGLQLSAFPGTFPFPALRAGIPVLFGAQRLLIEAIDCSLDLSYCSQWNPLIEKPDLLDMGIVERNRMWLQRRVGGSPAHFAGVRSMANSLCGRGSGLTPAGDDMLAGWMAVNWLLYGPAPRLLEACQEIISVARQKTHLLSQCWLGYAAAGNVALPIQALLDALTKEDESQLAVAAQEVLSMGATSGHDVIQGILLGLEQALFAQDIA